MTADSSSRRGLLEIHGAVFLFGLSGLFAKFLALPPTAIVLGRTFFAALALGLVLRFRRAPVLPLMKRDLTLVGLGALLALHWWSFFYSIRLSSIAIGLLTFSSFPVFVTYLEPLLDKTRATARDFGFALAVIAGVALVVPNFDPGDMNAIGALWGLFSGLTFAILQVLNRRFVAGSGPLRIAFVECVSACVLLLVFVGGAIPALDGLDLAKLIFLGVMCTALAHALFISGLQTVRTQTASVIAALEPVYGILLAAIFFGEIPSLRMLAGGGIILVTVVVMQRQAA